MRFAQRSSNPAIERFAASKLYRIKQNLQGSLIAGGTGNAYLQQTGSDQYLAYFFSFADLSQYASFAAIFDQYRIDMVEIRFTPQALATTITGGAVDPTTNLFGTVLDWDDANALSSTAAYREYDNWKSQGAYDLTVHKRKFVPRIAVGAYGSSAFGQYTNLGPQWIDSASTAVQHYGVKILVPANGTAATYQTWIVEATYWVSLRSVR